MPAETDWQCAVRCALRRVATWRTPPNWSRRDWMEEMHAEAEAGGWKAFCEYDSSTGCTLFQFVYRHTVNTCLQRYRQEWRYALHCHPIEDYHPFHEEPSPELGVAMAHLPLRDRELLYALFWEGRSETDVAREQGISVQAVSQHKRRALRRLRGFLWG